MFRPSEYADGATGGEPQGPPNVYLPRTAPPPAYDAYADPAAAHGWQDVYEREGARGGAGDTRELPPVPAHGRSGAGRRSRRRPGPWRARRVAVAAGAVGAVSAAALIAGLSLSDAPSGGARGGEGGRTGPTAGESPTSPPTGTGPASTPAVPLVGGPADGDEPSGAASASPSTAASRTPSESGTDAGSPSADSPMPSAPTVTTSAPGRSEGRPGHGPGGTKGPK
ncbi:hypothetical protein [Streptomyces purpurascens]|uniref:hypothetical protein n=1 Tax=Streptomyces purpurascens TaxID=1924 RepID=UPI0016733E58|nr:hypothetical protein [Streptomyces purpurascens]MCE7045645.1 hypothetical protein [Streptomyces purpurascens]GHA08007.1 hypothetical protein GCM10010303_17300 [Streptomyces purpurascens]